VADCGTVIHPQSLSTQINGGAVQGFGLALGERHIFDPQLGLSGTRGLYASRVPTYLDVPLEMHWDAVNEPDPYSPIGSKGIGEPPLGSAAAAVICAISDALGGVYFHRTPVTADMILNTLEGQPQSYKPLEVNV
jgi:CO/xanthine dehydrogenase Mo-binding subunit